jgi:hypothetical protein
VTIAIGDRVRLRIAAYGKPGVVVEQSRGKCRVRWDDLELETKHRTEDLIGHTPNPPVNLKGPK